MSKQMNPLMTARSVAINRKDPQHVDGRRASFARQLSTVHPVKNSIANLVRGMVARVKS